MDTTACDAVMVGRALTARPWMLWQLGERWGFQPPDACAGRAPRTGEEEAREYGRALIVALTAMERHFTEAQALQRFRFLVKVGHVWLNFGHQLYALTTKAGSTSELRETLSAFFLLRDLAFSERTALRY
jgi:tRNA-dihydrouridine synthase